MLLLNFFKRKIRFFRFPLPSFRHFFLAVGIIFMFFPVQGKKFFSPFSSFSYFSRGFSKEKSLFSGMNFRPNVHFFPSSGSISGFFSCHPIKNSILPEVFFAPSGRNFHLSGSFCTNQTRAHLHARNNILSTTPGFLSLISKNMS